MRTRQLERRKRLTAMACAILGWLGAAVYWLDAFKSGTLPWKNPAGYPVDLASILILLIAVAGLVAAMPDDREDVSERELWSLVLWCLGPVLLLGWLFFYPLAWFR